MDTQFELPMNSPYKPISGYGVIGNNRTVALVGYDGSIDWCCLPRFDSPSVFGAILDAKKGGRWMITPADGGTSTQAYMSNTNVLRTSFESSGSRVTLTDFMPRASSRRTWGTPPEIHRVVTCTQGAMKLRFLFEPAFQYGRASPSLVKRKKGYSMLLGKDEMALSSSVPLPEPEGKAAEMTFPVSRGEEKTFVLSYGEPLPRAIDEYGSRQKLNGTLSFWRGWVRRLNYSGKWRDMVIRSALALKLLVYAPTGAVIAAPTTSLPEAIGGERNWDYRFSWLRDSVSSLWAFHILGDQGEAEPYLHWLADNNVALDVDLKLMYDLDGKAEMPEKSLAWLEGYRGSAPVRTGNGAVEQVQLDAYGYMLDALYFSTRHGRSTTDEMYYRFVKPLADFICKNWRRRGNGIWEIRNRREHHVYTKAWCYAGLDRAVKIAREIKRREPEKDAERWRREMRLIKDEVLDRGWNSQKHAFTMSYESDALDAANLMLPLIGFLGFGDRKTVGTVEAVRKKLAKGSLVYRYRQDDGLRGKEGAFLVCSFWLIACLAGMGLVEEAERSMEELVACANHLGLFSEEYDPDTGEALGNFPQAFSHMGLILAANRIARAKKDGSGQGSASRT